MIWNAFEKKIAEITTGGLLHQSIETLEVNLGLRCNQQCHHCRLEASPHRSEMTDWPTMELAIGAAERAHCELIDLTGGASELRPRFRDFIAALRKRGHEALVRTNLTVLLEATLTDLPGFRRDHRGRLIASALLP